MTQTTRTDSKAAHLVIRSISVVLLTLSVAAISGCGVSPTASTTKQITGSVHGGQQPVTGSNIQLYAVGTTGDGSASSALLTSTVTTDNNGNFSLTGLYTCPTSPTQVYLLATGGNPGLGAGTNNPQLAIMAGLGLCSSLSSTTYITVNEVTTVATVAALAPYMTSATAIGAGSDYAQLSSAMAEVAEYANTAVGSAPGPSLPSGYTASTTALQTLADVIAACVNSSGGAAGDTTSCGTLFSAATPSGGTAPTDTIAATLSVLTHPTSAVSAIFSLVPSIPPFQPTLTVAPADWSLPIVPSAAGSFQFQSATYTAVEGSASVTLGVTYTGTTAASVQFGTLNGTASAGRDYSTTTGSLTWPAGDTSTKSIVIPLSNPGASATTRAFSVVLNTPYGATLGTTQVATVLITDSDTALAITNTTLPGATQGAAYNATLAATGGVGSLSWAVASGSSLPAGLTLSSAGAIGGTPTVSGTASVIFAVTDSATPTPQTVQATLSIAIAGTSTTIPTPDSVVSVQFPGYSGSTPGPTMTADNLSGGVITVQNWNVGDTATGTSPASNASTLTDSAGNSTSLGYTFSGYDTSYFTGNENFPAPLWYLPGGAADDYLALGTAYSSAGVPLTLSVIGLDPNHYYSLIVLVTSPSFASGYSASASVGTRSYYITSSNSLTSWTRATSTTSSAPTIGNYVQFDNLNGSSAVTATLSGAFVGVAGFQVVDYGTVAGGVSAAPILTAVSVPTLPTFSSGAQAAAASALQLTVQQASQPVTVAPSGATVNVGANFYASWAVSNECTLNITLVDANNNTVASVQNALNAYDRTTTITSVSALNTTLPTYLWSGPITITTPITLPQLADGTYYIMLSLSTTGNVQLTPGAGVVQDNQFRYYIGAITLQASAAAPSYLPPVTLDLTGYHLTFDDEFTSLSVSDSLTNDGSRWYTHIEQCCIAPTTDNTYGVMAGLSNSYGATPFSLIAGGGLDIRLQEFGNVWTSGILTSVDGYGSGFSQQYGYFEMKAKFPTGIDTWPAFWLLNTANKVTGAPGGEIDIVEYVNNPSFANDISTTLHDYSQSSYTSYNVPGSSVNLVPAPSGDFHTYGMMWTATTMTFYFDGTVTFQCPTPSIMRQPYYLLVDLGLGAGYPTKDTPTLNDMQVQYIRAYSK